MTKGKITFWLILIFGLAFLLRAWEVNSLPTFISDEASIGYNAYSLLKTGKDEWGNFLPLTFKSFGEHKLPTYIYLSVPSIAIFGLNELGTRFPSILFGSLTVVAVYFLVKELFDKKVFASQLALLSAFLLSISPWHLQMSRIALEANLSLFMIILGVLFFLKGLRKNYFSYVSFLLFGLSFYTYNSARVFGPLLLLGLIIIFRKEIKKDYYHRLVLPLVLLLIILVPLFFSGFRGSGERLTRVGIFADPGLLSQINEQRTACQEDGGSVCRFLYNRPITYSLVFLKNYLSHFSWPFLFSKGAGLAQYTIPNKGVLYLFQLPLVILGLVFLRKFKKPFWVLLVWLFLAPLANSITGQAHPVRSIYLLPVFQILGAAGVVFLIESFKKRTLVKTLIYLGFFCLAVFSLVNFLKVYFIDYPQVHTSTWQAGYKELYPKLVQLEKDYSKIYVSKFYGEPHIFYLFYNQIEPTFYQEGEMVVKYDRDDQWVNVDQIGQYYFLQEVETDLLEKRSLLVVSPKQLPDNAEIIEEIKYNDGEVAFVITEIK